MTESSAQLPINDEAGPNYDPWAELRSRLQDKFEPALVGMVLRGLSGQLLELHALGYDLGYERGFEAGAEYGRQAEANYPTRRPEAMNAEREACDGDGRCTNPRCRKHGIEWGPEVTR